MPILYGGNTFSFPLAAAVRAFKDEGIRPTYYPSHVAATQQELKILWKSGLSGNIESPLADLPLYHGQCRMFWTFQHFVTAIRLTINPQS